MKRSFTLVELLVAVSIVVVVLLSLFGIFHGAVVGYLSVWKRAELNRMLIAFDLDLNRTILGLVPVLPSGYLYLYMPPERKDGLLLFVVTSYSRNELGVVEKSYWLRDGTLYYQVDVPVDGKINGFNEDEAHILLRNVKDMKLCLEGKRGKVGGVYEEYDALPRYLWVNVRVGTSEIEESLQDEVKLRP